MELLLAAASSLVLEVYKWVSRKYGKEVSKRAVYLGLFALTLLWSLLIQTGTINQEVLQSFVNMVLYALGLYELIIKHVTRGLMNTKKVS